MERKKIGTAMGLFILATLFYYTSGYLLGTSNAILAGAGISVSTSYDTGIISFAILSGIAFAYGMIILGAFVKEQKEKPIGSAKKILS